MQPTAEQFTEKAWAAIVAAQQIAQTSRHQQLETEHLFLALLQQNVQPCVDNESCSRGVLGIDYS